MNDDDEDDIAALIQDDEPLITASFDDQIDLLQKKPSEE